jgi:hypothetical protein
MSIDIKLKDKNPYTMCEAEFEQHRAEFFASAFFDSFIKTHDIRKFQTRSREFFLDTKTFLGTTCFETNYSHILIQLVQDNWWQRICALRNISEQHHQLSQNTY